MYLRSMKIGDVFKCPRNPAFSLIVIAFKDVGRSYRSVLCLRSWYKDFTGDSLHYVDYLTEINIEGDLIQWYKK